MQNTRPSVEKNLTHDHNSTLDDNYHFIGPFESHHVYRICCNGDEQNSHDIEIDRPPMQLKDHIWIPCDEDNQVDLLGFIGNTNHILIGEDFEEEH